MSSTRLFRWHTIFIPGLFVTLITGCSSGSSGSADIDTDADTEINTEPDAGAAQPQNQNAENPTSNSTDTAAPSPVVTAPNTNTATMTPEPASPAVATVQTADLQTDATFDFATSWDMTIDFILPLTDGFLSLCTDYTLSDTAQPDVAFDSCVVRTPFNDGSFQVDSLPMTNEITSLIAALVDYDNPTQPLFVEFLITVGQPTLSWDQGTTL